MASRPELMTTRVLLTSGKPKPLNNSKNNLPKVKCSYESVIPLRGKLNCQPKALLKFQPLPPLTRLGDQKCDTQKQRDHRKRALDARKRKQLKNPLGQTDSCKNDLPALDGRLHQKVQTEVYLEELKEFREEKNSYCQTDLFLDRPPTPYFIPGKIGLDKETQIYDGDLFDFDIEVQAVLEVLVGKVVEQSLIEVQEEEELANLRQKQKLFEELRNAEFEEQQRLEEQERRIKEEKMERLKQMISRQRQEKLLEKKISAVAYSRGYIGALVSATFGELISSNHFYDDKEKVIETLFKQQVLDLTKFNVKQETLSRRLLDYMIRTVVQERFDLYYNMMDADFEEINQPKDAMRTSVRGESYDPMELPAYLNVFPKTEEEIKNIVEQIKNVFFLKNMPESHLRAIATGLSERLVSANENIFRVGDIGDEFYIIKSGNYEMHSINTANNFSNKGFFGEMSLMYDVTRKANVKATSDGLLWFMKRSNFKQIITKSEDQVRKRHATLLRKMKLFKFMTELELEKTADALRYISYKDGEVIFKQGDKADSLVIIDTGKAKLITTSDIYPEGKVTYMEKENYFGELALISEIMRSSTVEAVGNLTVLVLEAEVFARMIGNAQEIALRKKKPQ